MKILLVTPTLNIGGSERIIAYIADYLCGKGHGVTVLVLTGNNKPGFSFFNTVIWNYKKVSYASFGLARHLRSTYYDVVFSSSRTLNIILSCFRFLRLVKKLIIRENTIFSIAKTKLTMMERVFFEVSQISYRYADIIICQSEDMYNDIVSIKHIRKKRVILVNNPANQSFGYNGDSFIKNRFISVGRLDWVKGYERVIKALRNLTFEWEYHIIGSGPSETALRELIEEMGLVNQVFLKGQQLDVSNELKQSHLYFSGSFFEGFPNSVLEASLSGVPVIYFDAPGGTKDIITDGQNGYCVKKDEQFHEAVEKAIIKEWDRARIAECTKVKFDYDKIMTQYHRLFKSL